jgi:leader peptidase (prepilin peptidase)/N-methyltransferase
MAAIYVCIFVFGLITGACINIIIYRIPRGVSVVSPPSCTACGKRLAVADLIPVFSYIFSRGRCRYCRVQISPRNLLTELLTAAVFAVLFARFGFTVPFFAFTYLMIILIAVFFIDIDHRIIPNGLVLAAMAGGLLFFVYNCIDPMPEIFGDNRWWTPLAGIFPGSVFLLLMSILGSMIYGTGDVMGMGDVKLMAPVGLFLGWKLCIAAMVSSVLLGGIASILLMLFGIKKRKDKIAFGPFIVIGAFVTIMWGWELADLFFTYIG